MQLTDCPPAQHYFARKLQGIAFLTTEERQALLKLPMAVRCYSKGQDIHRDGERSLECCLLLEGFTISCKLLSDGRRQIAAFHVPGDLPNLQSLHVPTMDHSMVATVATKVAFVSHGNLRELMDRHPGLLHALWRSTLIDAAIAREWMVGVGQRSALERLAHLICEMLIRLEVVGLAPAQSFKLPVGQADLADTLGLSTVHVNRMVQELRRSGLITWTGTQLTVVARKELQAAASFDATYLQQFGMDQDKPQCAA